MLSGNDSQLISHVPVPVVPAPESASDQPLYVGARVLHVVNGEHFSGAERVQSHLGRCLPEYGVSADFACVKPGKFAQMLREQNGQWGKGFDASMSSKFDLRVAWQIAEIVRSGQYELLHAHTPRTALVAGLASRLARVPWIYHVHSPASRDSAKSLSNRVNAWTERVSLWNCSHLVTVSESLRLDCIAAGHDESQISVVHNGVPGIRPKRESTPVAGGRWTIGMVALMRARKGLEVVLEALAILREQGHEVVLRSIGPFETEEYEAAINEKIDELKVSDLVERVGFTENVPAELAKLDAMVLPSLFGEGLPMVVLEAMAAAVPVIATRVEGTPEAVTDGLEGLLAEPGDAKSLAGKIADLVTGEFDWHQMSEAAFERHAKDFSDYAMARGTARVYQQVLSNDS